MDTLDGRYSRMSGKGTLFGAFLDSTLDRIEEGIVLAAVAGYFAATGNDFAAAMCVVAVLGSLMVSYTRARAEALGRRVQGRLGDAARCGWCILSIGLGLRQGRRARRLRAAGARGLRDRGADHRHDVPARMARPKRAIKQRPSGPPRACNRPRSRVCFATQPDRERTSSFMSESNGATAATAPPRTDDKVRVAIVGVGNCANAFVQGIHYYRDADPAEPGSRG